MQKLVNQFIRLANAFDVEGTLALFTPDAVIEDVSVGCAFAGIEGIRRYLEQFFVGYNTASKLLSLEHTTAAAMTAFIEPQRQSRID